MHSLFVRHKPDTRQDVAGVGTTAELQLLLSFHVTRMVETPSISLVVSPRLAPVRASFGSGRTTRLTCATKMRG